MRRKLRSIGALCLALPLVLSGCALNGSKTQENETTNVSQNEELESGTIELTIWSESDNFDTLNKMIDSFKAEYGV